VETTVPETSAPETTVGVVPYSVTEQDVEVLTFGVLGGLGLVVCLLVAIFVRGGS
jgi:hypothetical protein